MAQPHPDRLVEEVRALLDRRQNRAALRVIDQHDRANDDWRVTRLKGLAHFNEREYAEAEACIRRARALSPSEIPVVKSLFHVLHAQGRRAEARQALRDLSALHTCEPGIEISKACNYRCTMCPTEKWEDTKSRMPHEEYSRILSQLEKDQLKRITLSGAQGDPTMHPDFLKFAQEASDRDFELIFSTNGLLLVPEKSAVLAAMNLATVQFSFCGFDKESYELTYRNGNFDKVLRNLTALRAALREAGSKCRLFVNGVVSDEAAQQYGAESYVRRTREFLEGLGIDDYNIHLASNWGGQKQVGSYREELKSHSHIESLSKLHVCPVLWHQPGIQIGGRVTACLCFDFNCELEIGNILEHTLLELRQQDPFIDMIEAFYLESIEHLPMCATCEVPYDSRPSPV